MLELQRWLLKLQNPHWEMKWPHWDIIDPETHQQVGVLRAQKPSGGFFGSWNPRLEARAVPEDALVFSLCWQLRLWRAPLQVWGPDGEPLGSFKPKWFSMNGGYWVYDGRRRLFGQVRADWTDYEFRLLNAAGEEVGTASRKLVGLKRAFLYNERDFLVTAGEGIANQPDTKRLLLASALAASALSC